MLCCRYVICLYQAKHAEHSSQLGRPHCGLLLDRPSLIACHGWRAVDQSIVDATGFPLQPVTTAAPRSRQHGPVGDLLGFRTIDAQFMEGHYLYKDEYLQQAHCQVDKHSCSS